MLKNANSGFQWLNSIFFRLLFVLTLMIILAYLVGVVMYNWGVDTVREEISDSMQSQVIHYRENLENEISRIQMLQYETLNDENLYLLATIPGSMNKYERNQSILRLQQHLNAVKNSSAMIVDVLAYILPSNIKISAVDKYSPLNERDLAAIKQSSKSNASPFIRDGDSYLMTSRFPTPSSGNRNPLYILNIKIDKKTLQETLKPVMVSDQNGSGGFLIGNQGVIADVSSERDSLSTSLSERVLQLSNVQDVGSTSLVINEQRYMVFYSVSRVLNLTVVKYLPESGVFHKLKDYVYWFWLFTIVIVVLTVIVGISIYRIIHRPLIELVRSFRKVEYGEFDIQIEHRGNDEFKYLYHRFNLMVKNLSTLIDQVYRQKILAQRAELKHLQSQISPHFLYNSFFILHHMVNAEDYENVSVFTKQLGSYLEYVTRSAEEEVPLAKDIEHARIYCLIQARRFRNRIRVEFAELPDDYHMLRVPRLIAQPLIENVFSHGLKNKMRDGLLQVSFHTVNWMLYISIEDNGEEVSQEHAVHLRSLLTDHWDEEQETTGLLNVHRRLRLKFGKDSGIAVSIGELGGLKVTAMIKLEGLDEDVPHADRG
ncbi:sensor histidine kinase [Paenibacillus spongiae]|uniref:Histidine kinase n=1 Tax=Paenibacillus spongiae TaxID=2909671 RepID=A0ABY5SA66_9BACL|nr:histidine kinase [Paenibacillus spongiae]UVI29430.1 histidine kinase [Paenibacillus spongiae]